MHKVLTAIVISLIAFIAVGAAWAAGPTFRDRVQISETDTDFCGTGKTVLIDGQIVANGWIAEAGEADDLVKLTFNLTITYTNPLNGAPPPWSGGPSSRPTRSSPAWKVRLTPTSSRTRGSKQ